MEQSPHHAKRLLPLSPPLGRRRVHPRREGAPEVGGVVEAAREGDSRHRSVGGPRRGEEPSSAANPLVVDAPASLSPPGRRRCGPGCGSTRPPPRRSGPRHQRGIAELERDHPAGAHEHAGPPPIRRSGAAYALAPQGPGPAGSTECSAKSPAAAGDSASAKGIAVHQVPGPEPGERLVVQHGARGQFGPRQAAVEQVRWERHHEVPPRPLEAERSSVAGSRSGTRHPGGGTPPRRGRRSGPRRRGARRRRGRARRSGRPRGARARRGSLGQTPPRLASRRRRAAVTHPRRGWSPEASIPASG